ncbi:MAG: hypothetical protein JWL63_1160 [Rhodocyclales bacterium]|nr:hypothetical protein [Rhodocyclales bacterium]
MFKKYALGLSAVATLLTACASSPTFDVKTANLASASTRNLCSAYGAHGGRLAEIKSELTKRNALTPEEWTQVENRIAAVGMSECALFAVYPEEKADDIESIKDAIGDQSAKDVTFLCEDAVVPFCPSTVFQIRKGRIKAIEMGR